MGPLNKTNKDKCEPSNKALEHRFRFEYILQMVAWTHLTFEKETQLFVLRNLL
jgi:hypothetical protein